MVKFFKRLLLLIFSLSFIVILILFSSGNTIIDYFIQKKLQAFNTEDLDIVVNNPSLNFFKFSIEDLTINKKVKFINLPIEFNKIDFEPNILSLFSDEKRFKLYSNFYSGDIKVDGGYVMDKDKLSSKIDLEGVMLESHQIFKQFSISGGKLNSNCKKFETKNKQVININCYVKLVDLKQPNSFTIPTNLSGLPLPIKIPALKVKEVKFDLVVDSRKVSLNNFSLVSDLANMIGDFEFKQGSMNIKLDLLERGVAEFGSLLRALSNSPKNSRKFTLTATKHFRDLKIRARM